MKLQHWRDLGSAVYENDDGTRVHVDGMCRIGSRWISGTDWPECQKLRRFVSICGGNRKRGVMAWAESLDKPA